MCKSIPFSLQYAVFCSAKDHILHDMFCESVADFIQIL